MDSVIVFFGTTPYEAVERALKPFGLSEGTVTQGLAHFYFWRYSEQERSAERDENELALLEQVLGSKPQSAFQVASRHNESSRLALDVVSRIMSQLTPSVLDDDAGNFWSPSDVQACFESEPSSGIFSLRTWPNPSFNGTPGGAR